MKKCACYFLVLAVVAALLFCALYYTFSAKRVVIKEYKSVDRPARIRPDYSETTISWNIAPLNFVKIYSKEGPAIEVVSRSPKIEIPETSWRELLTRNKGRELYFEVSAKTEDGQWTRFSPISNKIANEDIDSFLVYRKIYPLHHVSKEMGIYQRVSPQLQGEPTV